jgi:arabinogalactan endo-1,4-beta-galactosidase
MILGIDVSTYLEELEHGATYFDGDKIIDPLNAFVDNGVNCMRIRVWNNPYSESGEPYLAGNCDVANYVKLGKLARERGFDLMMDLHYSDFWADPGKQMIPKAWVGFDINEMSNAVYKFTKDTLLTAIEKGVEPKFIQVGNEITNGILWPIGKLVDGTNGRENYNNLCRLIDAGCRACREVCPEAKIILHLEKSNDQAVYKEFFTNMKNANIDYDIIGASYYPYWHGTPEELFANLDNCRRFGKEIMVVELGYGFTDKPYVLDGEERRLVIDSERAYVKGVTEKYPLTPNGQSRFIRDFLSTAKSHEIDGVFYWEPLWLPGKNICWASEAGQKYIHEEGKSTANEWANQCLFDYNGQKLPAFDEYKL